MRLPLLVGASVMLVILCPGWAQEKSSPLPQERFIGDWVNVDDEVLTAKRLVISKADNTWTVEAYVPSIVIVDGAIKEQELSLGMTTLRLAGDSPDEKAMPYGFLTRDLKISMQYSSLRIEKDELIVETFTIFGPNVKQSNYRTLEKFKKK
jgi:hypothetical protein